MDSIADIIRRIIRPAGGRVARLPPSPKGNRLTCREFDAFLMDYLSGDLPQAKRFTFEQHLASCPHCHTYLKSYKETVQLGKVAFLHPGAPVPVEVPEELVQAILVAQADKAERAGCPPELVLGPSTSSR
jgi:anti-sigma factor RsiW